MKHPVNYKRLEHWIENKQAQGKLWFDLNDLREHFKNDNETSLKQLLQRLSLQGKIVSIFKGFYVIVPPQYSLKGIIPPVLFIDGLMRSLQRKYYLSLLNAATLHGSSHHQPQEYFITTGYPVLRATNKKGVRINYISTKQFPPESLIEKRKTETGYFIISNPLLTAVDLISLEKRIGGLNRAASVIKELVEPLKPRDIKEPLIRYAHVTSLQRLGIILEEFIHRKDLADKLYRECRKEGLSFYLIPLKASGEKKKGHVNDRWKIVINTEIEIDE